jgi:hypothetical protein
MVLPKVLLALLLLAKEFIDNDAPLVMANSDQFVEWNSMSACMPLMPMVLMVVLLHFKATHPKWSYAKIGEDGFVSEVAEKKPISDNATVGIYYWKKGSDYVKYAEQMIERTSGLIMSSMFVQSSMRQFKMVKKIRIKDIERNVGYWNP